MPRDPHARPTPAPRKVARKGGARSSSLPSSSSSSSSSAAAFARRNARDRTPSSSSSSSRSSSAAAPPPTATDLGLLALLDGEDGSGAGGKRRRAQERTRTQDRNRQRRDEGGRARGQPRREPEQERRDAARRRPSDGALFPRPPPPRPPPRLAPRASKRRRIEGARAAREAAPAGLPPPPPPPSRRGPRAGSRASKAARERPQACAPKAAPKVAKGSEEGPAPSERGSKVGAKGARRGRGRAGRGAGARTVEGGGGGGGGGRAPPDAGARSAGGGGGADASSAPSRGGGRSAAGAAAEARRGLPSAPADDGPATRADSAAGRPSARAPSGGSAPAASAAPDEAEDWEASMPADDELMALPLTLGVGRKPLKPSRGGGVPGGRPSRGRPTAEASRGDLPAASSGSGAPASNGRTAAAASRVDDGAPAAATDRDAGVAPDARADAAAEGDPKAAKRAEWYDPADHARMEAAAAEASKEATASSKDAGVREGERGGGGKRRGGRSSKGGAANENFVRLDLRNAAGSCRGARNLKKANRKKLWRATHRFGRGDDGEECDGGEGGGEGPSRCGPRGRREGGGGRGGGGGDARSVAVARNGGVDPLDDYVDGAFSRRKDGGGSAKGGVAREGTCGRSGDVDVEGAVGRRSEDDKKEGREVAPLCVRHRRPCKLLTVKRNAKGNKGRKFYVCSLPRGEQCDHFQWEEDTAEAARRALLRSSSDSGFVARQVAAARSRFQELTVPELRAEAKKRGLRTAGKKDQILARLSIWVRDEVAGAVGETSGAAAEEGEAEENDAGDVDDDDEDGRGDGAKADATTDAKADATDGKGGDSGTGAVDDDRDVEGGEPDETEPGPVADAASAWIELSDDESDCESDYESDECYEDDVDDEPGTSGPELRCKAVGPAESDEPNDPLLAALYRHFGHATFRPGQEWAIRRSLVGRRSLLVAPTGGGKSLCYALPAALAPEGGSLCLVVSPLISLMQDQLRQLPPRIPAATLSGSMTAAQMALVVDDVLRGRYRVLFVSPERLASAAFRRLLRPRFDPETRTHVRKFPTVSLLCVDEAHCLSQWGHNFRPSYLRVRSLLPLIRPKSVLALTATAGPTVVRDICDTLGIPFDGRILGPNCPPSPSVPPEAAPSVEEDAGVDDDGNGVRVLNCNRDNIDVHSVLLRSNDERRYLLHKILMEKKGDGDGSRKLPIEEGCLSRGSVIVYVWRQKDTEIVAEQLNGAGVRGGVVCYHGGMDSNGRSRAQSKFLRGKARICVATVAFGLGINKPDIEGVVHLCLPPSPEHYLQEIGRAGRDGRPAKAIALPLQDELVSRHSLAHSDRLSKDQLEVVFLRLRKLVEEALSDIPPEAGVDLNADELFVDDLHVAMPVAQTVDASDCKEESIETILSLLEGDSNPSRQSLLAVEGFLPDAATITLKKRSLEKLGKVEQIALSIGKCGLRVDEHDDRSNQDPTSQYGKYQGNFGGTAMEKGFYAYSFGTYQFSVVRCARCMGPQTEPRHVYAALRRLQGNGELELVLNTTASGRAMHLRMKRDGIRLFHTKRADGSIVQEESAISQSVRTIVTEFSEQFAAKEKVSVGKVESVYEIMHHVSLSNEEDEKEEEGCDDDCSSSTNGRGNKSPRLMVFQKLVENYFRDGGSDENRTSKEVPVVIKDFPVNDMRLLSCLSSDLSTLMQMLKVRRQERMPLAVRIDGLQFSEYRNLCLSKILHSIDAPRAPILEWYNQALWGKYRSYSFSSVVRAVQKIFEDA
ncbi:hypothetical protein ACHAWF_011322 [Thalassiosira exigua]